MTEVGYRISANAATIATVQVMTRVTNATAAPSGGAPSAIRSLVSSRPDASIRGLQSRWLRSCLTQVVDRAR